jgi:CheY-like chemotaxis protein
MTPPRLELRVLLVDRDDDTRRLYSEYLKQAGCATDEAQDGRDALAKALSRHYDVVVTETRLPGIDGYELCDRLRRDATTHALPIVIVTGEAQPGELERARRVGADVVLMKPSLPETVLLEIRRLLEAFRNPAPEATAWLESARPPGARRHGFGPRDPDRQTPLSRTHQRGETREPPATPPTLVCPVCDYRLIYQCSHVGGVNARNPEQWDYYECPKGCGRFQYRQRTRKLRSVG